MFAALPEEIPIGGPDFRERVFSGAIFKLQGRGGADPARVARAWLTEHSGPIEELARTWRARDWSTTNQIQKALSEDPEVRRSVREFVLGMAPDSTVYVGNPRLRVVFPDGHLVPRAAAAYLSHRDTWFANSESQINWWMPLLPITEGMSFGFCPEFFDKPVDNNSASFHYEQWIASGGFQRTRASQRQYPTTTVRLSPQRFVCDPNQYLCFSAAHLHQTMPVEGHKARISLDFRTVWSADRDEGRASPNVDNRSSGDATLDYARVLGTAIEEAPSAP